MCGLYEDLVCVEHLHEWGYQMLRGEIEYQSNEDGDWESRECPTHYPKDQTSDTESLEQEERRGEGMVLQCMCGSHR